MSDRSAGQAPSRVVAVLGPTNTGKTHLAVERMLGHASGMIGLPLRLLAREVYERIVRARGQASVALITGEEKIIPPRPVYFVCTVEAMPMEREVEFLAVDEIQLAADPERGHVFTSRLLHARGRFETMFLGASTLAPLIRRLIPDVEIVSRERLSSLTYAGSKKLTRLPRRSAIVAFSTEQVYAIAELIRRQRGGAAVVMGSLSPRTRNAQVALFQSGEVDFLVATDAIGMGLNMDVDHVAFAGLRKFDGRRTRWLHAHEIAQIAGRAGRHIRDGTFGVTGEATIMRLWEACQLPDFQKTTLDEHARLSRDVFMALTGKRGRLTDDWFAPRFAEVDRDDGQIDQLSARLAGVRTLSYIANRPDWVADAKGWRERTRALEDRLSDVLHERLTARFVDRKTTALIRSLHDREASLAEVAGDGVVTVDGEAVGHLEGVRFAPSSGGSALADRTLKTAALRAVGPEIARRLGRLAADADTAFTVSPDGDVLWQGALAARIIGGDPFSPRIRLIGDLGPQAARDRAQRRIEAFLSSEAGRALRDLRRLKTAIETGTLTGLPRGLAFRLVEAGGVIDRREVERDLAALSHAERRTLKTFAVRVGVHSVWLPGVLKPRGRALAQAFVADEPFHPRAEGLTVIPDPPPSPRALSAHGLRAIGRVAAPVETLERLAEHRRTARTADLPDAALADLGWTTAEARAILGALRVPRAKQPDRSDRPVAPPKDSPFAALAALTAPPASVRRKRPRRKARSV
ncbi:MAG: phosphonate-binding protein [Brevundimonas subvibrioides]|uniref:Phosphonate-binding protein n=1 Tax=Brevundimonas subvibrioides TaxID=74313 RepID=A0A258FG66_9CAUL|nr:MAG: phosphonate-binding protein [Brevundimonas subvibrioides]